jgi:hypothetical protein
MTQPKYYALEDLVMMIDEPNRSAIKEFVLSKRRVLRSSVGSTNNHQTWSSGWWDHTTEVMNLAVLLYSLLNSLRPLPFSLSDLLLVLFMHDIEKPWKYLARDGQLDHRPGMETKAGHQAFRMEIAKSWNIQLTDMHVNGIKYAEGELDDYNPRRRVMSPLAAVAHMCDNPSARLWPKHPFVKNDPWMGAKRLKKSHAFDEPSGAQRIADTPTPAKTAPSEATKRVRREEGPPGDCGVGCGCGFCN